MQRLQPVTQHVITQCTRLVPEITHMHCARLQIFQSSASDKGGKIQQTNAVFILKSKLDLQIFSLIEIYLANFRASFQTSSQYTWGTPRCSVVFFLAGMVTAIKRVQLSSMLMKLCSMSPSMGSWRRTLSRYHQLM